MKRGGTLPNTRQELADLWRNINREWHCSFRHAFRGMELSPVKLIPFRIIQMEPGITVSELARRCNIVKSHVSKMVDHLVQQGYVEKRPDPQDQRLVRLFLAQKAADAVAEMEALAAEVLNGVLSEVPEEEVDEIMRGLRILSKALLKSNEKVNT
jgi:DNA-binding MarR family transcriptional regulator